MFTSGKVTWIMTLQPSKSTRTSLMPPEELPNQLPLVKLYVSVRPMLFFVSDNSYQQGFVGATPRSPPWLQKKTPRNVREEWDCLWIPQCFTRWILVTIFCEKAVYYTIIVMITIWSGFRWVMTSCRYCVWHDRSFSGYLAHLQKQHDPCGLLKWTFSAKNMMEIYRKPSMNLQHC